MFTPQSDAGDVGPVFVAESSISEEPLPRLFRGELSDYHRARADDGDLVSTLRERLVPLALEFQDERQFATPLSWLEPGVYSLVTAPGQVTTVSVSYDGPGLRRVWPQAVGEDDEAASVARTGRVALYCLVDAGQTVPDVVPARETPSGSASMATSANSSTNDESGSGVDDALREGTSALRDGTSAQWTAAPGLRNCLLLTARAPISRVGTLSPMERDGLPVEPTLFAPSGEPRSADERATVCRSDESPLAVGCVRVEDDRMFIRGGSEQSLWLFEGDLRTTVASLGAEPVVVLGLTPGARLHSSLLVVNEFGVEFSANPTIVTSDPQSHVVISEVMANPLGPEPEQEWMELYNDGSAAVQLDGWQLSDGGASVELPPFELASGAYVVLVSQGFDETDPADVAPASGTRVLRLPQLGKSGLSNSGERLSLRSPDGQLRSTFPDSPKPVAGVSVARTLPHAPDGAAASFGVHGEPGASPGGPNAIR